MFFLNLRPRIIGDTDIDAVTRSCYERNTYV